MTWHVDFQRQSQTRTHTPPRTVRMLFTIILTGSHTIGNLVVSEAMCAPDRASSHISYMVPHSLNDQVHITVETECEADARALLRGACDRLATRFAEIMTTPPIAPKPTTVSVRTGAILTDADIK